jgi:hypothetical protein
MKRNGNGNGNCILQIAGSSFAVGLSRMWVAGPKAGNMARAVRPQQP